MFFREVRTYKRTSKRNTQNVHLGSELIVEGVSEVCGSCVEEEREIVSESLAKAATEKLLQSVYDGGVYWES